MTFPFLWHFQQTQAPCTCPLYGVPEFLSPCKSDPEESAVGPQRAQEHSPTKVTKEYPGAVCGSLVPSRVRVVTFHLWPVGPAPALFLVSYQQLGDPQNFAFSFSLTTEHTRDDLDVM